MLEFRLELRWVSWVDEVGQGAPCIPVYDAASSH